MRFVQNLGIAMVLIGWAGIAAGQTGPDHERPTSQKPSFMAGRIVVKLTTAAARQMAQAGTHPDDLKTEMLPLQEFREISRHYKVRTWSQLFPQQKEGSAGLERVYVVTFDPSVDVPTVCEAFKALSGLVEYAEPDSVLQVQQPADKVGRF